jgi:diguanylate cyclase (GGDEF)-like protein/PAS domain S-box-containing protein
VISNAICVAVMISLWFQNRRRSPEVGYWLAGFIMQFLGILLIAMRGIAPDFISIVAGNVLLIAGTYIPYLGLERYYGKARSQLSNHILLAFFFFIQVYYTFAFPSLKIRELNISAALLVICAQCAWLMLRGVSTGMRSATKAVGWIFFIYSLTSIARILADLAGPSGINLLQSGLFDTLVILTYQMLFISLTFAFFLMINRRLFAEVENELRERKRAEDDLHASETELQGLFSAMPDVILMLDKDGRYLKIAPTAPGLLFKPADELVGKNLHEVFPKEQADRFIKQIQICLESNQTVQFEYVLPIQERRVWFSASVSPMTNNSVVWVARDITEKKQAEALQEAVYRIAAAAETTRTLEELYPQIHQIISSVMQAENFYITLFDEARGTLQFPYNTDAIDKPFVGEVVGGKGITTYVLKTGKSLLCTRQVHAELARLGEVEFVGVPSAIWLGVPLNIEGKPIGVMVVQHYTDANAYTVREKHMLEFVSTQVAIAISRKQAEKKLENSEAELRALFAAMTDVVIIYDKDGCYRKIAPTDPGLLIASPTQLIGKSMYEVFPKEDADRLMQNIQIVLETGIKLETEYFLQIGERKIWFTCTISPFQVDSVIWVAHDISNRKQAEKMQEVVFEISKAAISTENINEFFRSIHTSLNKLIHVENFYIALYDPSSDLISFPYYVDQYDEPPADTKAGRGLTEYVMRIGKAFMAPRKVYDQLIEKGEIEAIGTPPIDWLGAPLGVEGNVIGVMATQSYKENIHFNQEDLRLFEFVSTQVAQMIDRKRIEEEFHFLSIHDSLTGLYNRAYFDEELNRLERGRHYPVSVLMVDVDDLKLINDSEGHAAGDEFLRRVAHALRSTFRVEDVVARIGGDEFAVLLPGINAEKAKIAKERTMEYIKNENATIKGNPLQISMGICTVEKGSSLVNALALADDQMYAEKQAKR